MHIFNPHYELTEIEKLKKLFNEIDLAKAEITTPSLVQMGISFADVYARLIVVENELQAIKNIKRIKPSQKLLTTLQTSHRLKENMMHVVSKCLFGAWEDCQRVQLGLDATRSYLNLVRAENDITSPRRKRNRRPFPEKGPL